VAENATWITSLVNAGEIQTVPSVITNTLTALCGVNAQNGFCYDATAATGTGPVIAFSRLESNANINRCTTTFAGTNRAYAVYSTTLGKGGIACTNGADPTVGAGLNMLP
jgi:hypothetical protein